MQTIGEKIALLVKSRGWQQKDFAAAIGYTAEHFSRLLKTDPLPGKALQKIATGLDISPEQLAGLDFTANLRGGGLVSEPDTPYGTARGAQLPAAGELEFLRNEIERLHSEMDRLAEQLTREQALSASLADTLNRLAGKK